MEKPKTDMSREVLGTSPSRHWLGGGLDSKLTPGAELVKRLSEGVIYRAPTEYIREVRSKVVEACDELIGMGARIRPLMAEKKRVGWVRGMHDTERHILRRWVPDPADFVFRCLLLTTSLEEEEVISLSSLEVHNLVQIVKAMGDRDASLYPYLSAFSTTRASEFLWHGGGAYASFENKEILMPDGKQMRVMCPSDHARLWASLCTYREQAKKRLDESWNAVLIMRPWAGKSVDGLAAELKAATKQMQADALEPWESVVKATEDKALDDGWAHLENMETNEGMLKELHGMLSDDRHERLMAKFEKQQVDDAERRRQEIERMVIRRGGVGINQETITFETEAVVRRKELELRQGKVVPVPVRRDQPDEGKQRDVRDKLKRYQQ